MKFDGNLNRVLETIALNGLVSGYKLSKILDTPLTNAQRWLSILYDSGELDIYKEEKGAKKRKKVLYGLTPIGLYTALSQPKVRRNFFKVFDQFLEARTLNDKALDSEAKVKIIEDLKTRDIAKKVKKFYIAVSDGLLNLYDINSLSDSMVIDLAIYIATRKEPKKMLSIFAHLYNRSPNFRRVIEDYFQSDLILYKKMKSKVK
ncbi:MAG: hypothetical protein NWF08_00685 [Candidatus Bathyarchaeota archaeon]|nr:hypothetical protein [Candidatus Bathyarchaeota archaeon]